MSIGTKLKSLIDYRDTNVNKLAKETNISPQTIYGIIKRDNTKVDIGILQALADNLNVTLDFFATGDTNKNSIEEEEIISLYKKLDAYGKEAVRLIAKTELERVKAQAQSGQAPSAEADKKPVDPSKL
ncbi:helix-turn-helix domain-containing protein [Peptococcus niger]|uniref:Transcriptional regulator, contains XRE-family HTH domain n=1 Tax=Peptococcus niger TaxID=2741 RepID=A0A1G6Z121_PEPNI|nr:helix-turn-helix transcriptional regulator [Peptococcus niger]SDD96310.1 Transcriptional regulator, contains XRE-family HTH domain [Peptococcus niger]